MSDGEGEMDNKIQIVVGTYDKVLHGVIATVQSSSEVEFLDNFLFEAHTSAVRCLALSPPSSSPHASERQKIILASGGSDEKINLYHIASSVPVRKAENEPSLASLVGQRILPNPRNRELGSILHHGSGVNALLFPTRSKLLSAADDNTVAITRTRDWTVLSSIKAPIPKAQGRPSGDTAPLGGIPAGINGFAVHPSMKLMVSVGKGEKCMRLWNLVTGKKAGVLNFDKGLLQGIGEGKWGSGVGHKVEWNGVGEEFLVAFEKGAVLFGMDSKPKARIMPSPPTKIHQIRYAELHNVEQLTTELIAVSTEDGRILLYLANHTEGEICFGTVEGIPTLMPIGQIGGDVEGRIKDFEILQGSRHQPSTAYFYVVSASSNGAICVWLLDTQDLSTNDTTSSRSDSRYQNLSDNSNGVAENRTEPHLKSIQARQVGKVLGKYNTGHRITCLKAFLMSDTLPKHTMPSKEDYDGNDE